MNFPPFAILWVLQPSYSKANILLEYNKYAKIYNMKVANVSVIKYYTTFNISDSLFVLGYLFYYMNIIFRLHRDFGLIYIFIR